MPRLRTLPVLFALVAAASSVLRAQVTTPQPLLTSLSPVAAQAGTKVEITVAGTDLDGASRLHFSVPGVLCEPKLDDKKQSVANKFVVTLPAGLPATTCDVRVVARYGISNPRGFAITTLPVVSLPATATSTDKAFAATLNTVLTGSAVKQAAGFIRFEAEQGQRVIAVCRPLALDSRMDAYISLRDVGGGKLGSLQPDGLLDFTAPASGAYMLEVHDLMFRGDAEFPFALTLTTGPVIERAFDGGAQWTLYGRHLPKGTDVAGRHRGVMQRVQVSADEARRMLTANPIRAVMFGAESDGPAASPPSVALKLPARHTGWFAPRGQARVFTFEAKRGDVLWIEVNCAAKGIVADPFFIVEKDEAFIAEAADRTAIAAKGEFEHGVADPALRFEAKEDGTYRVKLRNHFANGPQEPFELTIQPSMDDYELVAIPSSAPKAKNATTVEINGAPLWRGGVAVLKVFALRRGGFNSAIELAAEGLPADVKFLGGLIREGQSIGYAAFFADETAKEWAGALKLRGKIGRDVRGATPLFKVGNTTKESVLTRFTDEVVLGVTPADAPVTIAPQNAIIESDGVAKLSVPLQVTRRGDCTEAIKLTSLGVEGLTAEISAKATEGKLELDVAKLKLPAGDHPVVLQGTVKFKHQRGDDPKTAKELTFLVHSKPFIIRVKPAEKKA